MTVRKRSERRRLDSVVSVRFTPHEVDELRRRAQRMDMTISGYMRWLVLAPETFITGTNYSPVTVTVAGLVTLVYPEKASCISYTTSAFR
jgi:hypothetical protein